MTATHADPQTKAFPTADVLSTITGRMMGKIEGVYEVCDWMTGENIFEHQILRVCREAQAAMIAFRPDLAQAIDEAEQVNPENARDWLATWIARYGETIEVIKLNADQHERIDPWAELPEQVLPNTIMISGGDKP